MSFDRFFENSGDSKREFIKRISRIVEEFNRVVENGKETGNWKIEHIDRPDLKGYIIRGHFSSDRSSNALNPLNPLEPWNPSERRPRPKKRFKASEKDLTQNREPLTDVFEEDKEVKVYLEMPGEEGEDIQLNTAEGKLEVKGEKFYKTIDLPTPDIDVEKVTSKYKNGVLQVSIPKKEESA